MFRHSNSAAQAGLSRRALLLAASTLGAGALLRASPDLAGAPPSQPERELAPPRVGFHLDQPYLDFSGTAEPYAPAAGVCGAAVVAELGEIAFRASHLCL